MKKLLILLIRLISAVDYFYRRLVYVILRPNYVRKGSCKACGQCCKCILLEAEPWMLQNKYFHRFLIWWCSYFDDFIHLGTDADNGYISFTCQHILKNGKCGNYTWLRPRLCQEYPRVFNYFKKPEVLEGCGYRFESISLRK